MKNTILILILWSVMVVMSCTTSVSPSDSRTKVAPTKQLEQVYLSKKDGDSCLLEKQCKVIVSQDEYDINDRYLGKKYFRCLISNDYYEIIPEAGFVIKVDKLKCEEVFP